MALSLMIIDDDHVNSFVLKNIIQNHYPTATVSLFADGLEALDYLIDLDNREREFPNIILLNINLPILNGFGFLRRYEEKFGNKPSVIMAMSDSFSKGDQKEVNTYSFVKGFITKSLIFNNIGFVIDSYLSKGKDSDFYI